MVALLTHSPWPLCGTNGDLPSSIGTQELQEYFAWIGKYRTYQMYCPSHGHIVHGYSDSFCQLCDGVGDDHIILTEEWTILEHRMVLQ